jgi:predicted nucleotidyltransferase
VANHIKLPGILGAAAEHLGVSALAKEAGTNARTLYNWATNRSATPAIPALRLAAACQRLGLNPLRYRMPGGGVQDCIVSTPQGWIVASSAGHGAHRYPCLVDDPAPAPADLLAAAHEGAAGGRPEEAAGISPDLLEELVRRIVASVHPLRIILFGSAARGTMGPDSDLDLLVVMPDGVHRRDTAMVVYRSLRRFPYPKDIVVATVGDLVLYGDAIGMVYRQALREGRELYHAA